MQDRTITATTAAALFLWPAGLGLVLLDLFTAVNTGQLGLYLAMGGGVLNIRGFFCAQNYRERNAFYLGRDSVKLDSQVRPMIRR